MSLIVTVWTTEGIVMGSDSRVSFSSQIIPNLPVHIQTGHFFDTQEKTFMCPNNCGISTCGAASLQGKNITGFIYNFINNQITQSTSVQDTATKLKNYIIGIDSNAEVHFFVSGYDVINNQDVLSVYYVVTGNKNICNLISTTSTGAKWDGEIDTLLRIMEPNYICNKSLSMQQVTINTQQGPQNIGDAYILPANNTLVMNGNSIVWNLMTLQDAIDFVRYAINITIETMRFSNVNKTVGGPIDILVITPNKANWISHKALH